MQLPRATCLVIRIAGVRQSGGLDDGSMSICSKLCRLKEIGQSAVLRATESLLTHRWRGVDSNFRFRDALSSPTARPWDHVAPQSEFPWVRRFPRIESDRVGPAHPD